MTLSSDPTRASVFEEDELPSGQRESDVILRCIKRFNELMATGQYEAAAIHAATSPRAVLRNMNTLHRFKCKHCDRVLT